MADDWDDWGDGEDRRSDSDQSGDWDWPAESEVSTATAAADSAPTPRKDVQPQSTRDAQRGSLPEPESSEDAQERARSAEKVEERTNEFFAKLRTYQVDLADPFVRGQIDKELAGRDFAPLAAYYDDRMDLARYTLDTELQRMRYTVVMESGDALATDGANAVAEYLANRLEHAMVRMANQSILADMLEVLQGRLLRPDLETSVVSRDCSFALDFARGVLTAKSTFSIATVGSGGADAQETLEIAHMDGTVTVDTLNKACSHKFSPPQLRMVFDEDMRASARVLARHSLVNECADRDHGGSWSVREDSRFQSLGALRTGLARAGSDGMGRAAAVGTGLLANVVAGVGSAIGAQRDGVDSDGTNNNDVDSASFVRLYRRSDTESSPACSPGSPPLHSAFLAGKAPSASPIEPCSTRSGFQADDAPHPNTFSEAVGDDRSEMGRPTSLERTSIHLGEQGMHAISSQAGSNRELNVESRLPRSCEVSVNPDANSPGASDQDAGSGGYMMATAIGAASATGGVVLRGLWGGLRGMRSSVTSTLHQAGEARGTADVHERPAIELYRRDSHGSNEGNSG